MDHVSQPSPLLTLPLPPISMGNEFIELLVANPFVLSSLIMPSSSSVVSLRSLDFIVNIYLRQFW